MFLVDSKLSENDFQTLNDADINGKKLVEDMETFISGFLSNVKKNI